MDLNESPDLEIIRNVSRINEFVQSKNIEDSIAIANETTGIKSETTEHNSLMESDTETETEQPLVALDKIKMTEIMVSNSNENLTTMSIQLNNETTTTIQLDIENEPLIPIIDNNSWLKCGQIYIHNEKDEYQMKCNFCKVKIQSTDVFIQHIKDKHINPIDNINCTEDVIKHEENNKNTLSIDGKIYFNEIKIETDSSCTNSEASNSELNHDSDNESDRNSEETDNNCIPLSINEEIGMPKSKRDPKDGLYHCTKCSKSAKRFDLLKDHFYLKHTWDFKLNNENDVPIIPQDEPDPDDNKYHCTACLSIHGTYKAVLRHFRGHPGTNLIDEKPFKCSTCNSRFWTEQELKMHELIHLSERPREFVCEICTKTFPRKVELNRHISTTHYKNKPYSCSFCPKKFPSKSNKDAHEMLHNNSRPHLCETCGSAHVSRAKLEYHMRRHTGERRYKCTYCEKAFFDSKRLKDHLPVHTGEKNEPCDICQKKFSTRKQMMKHRKIHFDEKTYFCKICGESFKQDSALYRHKKNVHTKTFVHL